MCDHFKTSDKEQKLKTSGDFNFNVTGCTIFDIFLNCESLTRNLLKMKVSEFRRFCKDLDGFL